MLLLLWAGRGGGRVGMQGVERRGLTCTSPPPPILFSPPISKLALFLPNRVDHKRGTAKWDGAKEALVISLPVAASGLLG